MTNLEKIWESSDSRLQTIDHLSVAIKDVYDTNYPVGNLRHSITRFLNDLIMDISKEDFDFFSEFIDEIDTKALKFWTGHLGMAKVVVHIEDYDSNKADVIDTLKAFQSFLQSKYQESRQMSNDTA